MKQCGAPTSGIDVTNFLQQIVSGLASGGIYGSLALAIVIIHRSTGVINFAQGEMATLSAFVCWTLVDHGWSFWAAFGATLALSFAGGVALQAVVIKPIQGGPLLGIVILTIGLLIAMNGLTTWIWGGAAKQFHGPFSTSPITVGGVAFSKQDIGVIAVSVLVVVLVGLLFKRTKLGLGLRAAAVNPVEARLVGVRVAVMLAVGWGLAAMLGAVAGVMAAPSLFLEPNMMQTVLLYAFAAAVLGGMDSPVGAVVGGLVLGVLLNLVGTYVHWVGGELRLATALAVILGVLLFRPSGLFGRSAVRRA
jgi:branched-chain amino acid transport system permease protein